MSNSVERTRDDLLEEFGDALEQAEDLLKEAAEATGDRAHELRGEAEAKLRDARRQLLRAEDRFAGRARAAARRADQVVHDSPWTSLGVAAAVGFVAGLLINRR